MSDKHNLVQITSRKMRIGTTYGKKIDYIPIPEIEVSSLYNTMKANVINQLEKLHLDNIVIQCQSFNNNNKI